MTYDISAHKRTGPRTQWGKFRSSLNALKVNKDHNGTPLTPRDEVAKWLKSKTMTELQAIPELEKIYQLTAPSMTTTIQKALN